MLPRRHQNKEPGAVELSNCLLQLLRDYDAKEAVSENAVLDLLNYVADMLVGHPRTGRQTDAHLEQFLAHTVDVSRITSVHRLFVHRLPQRTRFDTCGIQSYAHCLHVIIGWQSVTAVEVAWVTPAAPPTAPVITCL